jgi:alanine dehydrogenase
VINLKIGIPKETKNNEFRVAVTPDDVKKLTEFGHEVFVEKNAGRGSGFSNVAYKRAGAKIRNDVYDSEMIVKVKAPSINTIRKNQTILAYHHVEKGQSPALLNTLLDQNVTAYAYEEIRDSNYDRLVNLGWEAGVVGMYEGLRKFLELNQKAPVLPNTWKCKDANKVFKHVRRFQDKNIKVAIIGNGKVSAGCQDVLRNAGITPIVLDRSKSAFIEEYLSEIDIVVNAVVWYPNDPQIIKRHMLHMMKRKSLIVDISCDEKGAVETCVPTSWEAPSYQIDGITHICIDNLPSAIPITASKHLSTMIIPYVLSIANRERLRAGLMTQNGLFVYEKPEEQGKFASVVRKQEIVVHE